MRLLLASATILALALTGTGCDTPGAEGAYYVPEPEPEPNPELTEDEGAENVDPWDTDSRTICEAVIGCYVMSGSYLCCTDSGYCEQVPHRVEYLCYQP